MRVGGGAPGVSSSTEHLSLVEGGSLVSEMRNTSVLTPFWAVLEVFGVGEGEDWSSERGRCYAGRERRA